METDSKASWRECWYNKLEILGDHEDVYAFLKAIEIPAAVYAENGPLDCLEIYGTKTFSSYVPSPEPSNATRVVDALNGSCQEVNPGWAKRNWGCASDFVEDIPARPTATGEGLQFTFFTYGGVPDLWCAAASKAAYLQGLDVMLVLLSHNLNGQPPDVARVFQCSGATGPLPCDPVIIEGADEVRRFLEGENMAWDGLTMGPFTVNPPILSLSCFLPASKFVNKDFVNKDFADGDHVGSSKQCAGNGAQVTPTGSANLM